MGGEQVAQARVDAHEAPLEAPLGAGRDHACVEGDEALAARQHVRDLRP